MKVKNYLNSLRESLQRGAWQEVASVVGVSKSLVYKVLRGERENYEVLRAAENYILMNGVAYLSWSEFTEVATKIFHERGAQRAYAAFMGEIILTSYTLPAQFDYARLPQN